MITDMLPLMVLTAECINEVGRTDKMVNMLTDIMHNNSFGLKESTMHNSTIIEPNEVTATEQMSLYPNQNSTPLWIMIFDQSQLAMVVVGFIANLGTFITLKINGSAFMPAVLTFLRHQSGIDAWICLVGMVTLIQPYMWMTGNTFFDIIVCHVWHSQAAYWWAVFISIWNLVAISFERFLAICYPFKHSNLTSKKVFLIIFAIYFAATLDSIHAFFQVSTENGQCLSEYSIKGEFGIRFFYGYSIFIFIVVYILPCALFVILYGMVILTFKQRQKQGQFASSRVIDKASAELTKTAVVVTAIFIVAIGYDLWYYMLGYSGILTYKMNSPMQKIGVWLSSFNSVANPFVYALLMPAYRISVKKTFCNCFCNSRQQSGNAFSSVSSDITSMSTVSKK